MRYVPIELNNSRLIIFYKSLEISNYALKYNAIMDNKRSSLKMESINRRTIFRTNMYWIHTSGAAMYKRIDTFHNLNYLIIIIQYWGRCALFGQDIIGQDILSTKNGNIRFECLFACLPKILEWIVDICRRLKHE